LSEMLRSESMVMVEVSNTGVILEGRGLCCLDSGRIDPL
jgi:hypothetical protein